MLPYSNTYTNTNTQQCNMLGLHLIYGQFEESSSACRCFTIKAFDGRLDADIYCESDKENNCQLNQSTCISITKPEMSKHCIFVYFFAVEIVDREVTVSEVIVHLIPAVYRGYVFSYGTQNKGEL